MPGSSPADTLQSSIRYCCGNACTGMHRCQIQGHMWSLVGTQVHMLCHTRVALFRMGSTLGQALGRPPCHTFFWCLGAAFCGAAAQRTSDSIVRPCTLLMPRPRGQLLKYHWWRQPVQRPGSWIIKAEEPLCVQPVGGYTSCLTIQCRGRIEHLTIVKRKLIAVGDHAASSAHPM